MAFRHSDWPVMIVFATLIAGPKCPAQPSNISPTNRYCWGENVGFLNWRDANAAAQGVDVRFTYLTGFIWCGNIGWINVGRGAPLGGNACGAYANTSGTDFGVNVAPNGALSGLAWGENVGWINFAGGALATPSQPARLDRAARRFRGYAWGEHIGWINLDNAGDFVGVTGCAADADGDGAILPADIALFVNIWFCSLSAGTLAGDFDGNGVVTPADVSVFVSTWFAALTGGC